MSLVQMSSRSAVRRLGFALIAGGLAAFIAIFASACGGGSDGGSAKTNTNPTVAQNGSGSEGMVTVYASPT